MHALEKELLMLIRRDRLLAAGEKVLIGVSAGPDSVALLYLLAALAPWIELAGLTGIYVDHGLRPVEVPEEKALVTAACGRLGVDCLCDAIDVTRHAAARKISIEHAARELRYALFAETARRLGAGRIAVAHTADDQAEEVLLRLLRGSGRAGLSGMRTIREGVLIRPLLTTPKAALLAYLAERKIPFLLDSSNLSRDHLRNRIRLDLLPVLRQYNANIDGTLRRTATLLQDEEELLATLAASSWQKVVSAQPRQGEAPEVVIDCPAFLVLDRAMQRRVVEMAFLAMASRPDFHKIEAVLRLAAYAEGGAQLHFSQGLRLKKIRKRLIFSFPAGRVARRGNLDEGF